MKEAIKSTTQENDMLKFYEEQLSDRDFTISELTTKLKKINEKVSQSFTDDEKSIEIKQLKLELEQVKLKLKEKENSIKVNLNTKKIDKTEIQHFFLEINFIS